MVEYRAKPLNRVFFALADPTRRAILLHVARGEARVTALAAGFTISLAAVSKHIRVLEEACLLKRAKQGRETPLAPVPRAAPRRHRWDQPVQPVLDRTPRPHQTTSRIQGKKPRAPLIHRLPTPSPLTKGDLPHDRRSN